MFNHKSELGSEAQSAKHSQGILSKSFFWFPHRANKLLFYINLSFKRVNEIFIFNIVSNRVHGEVATFQVVFERGSPLHLVWSTKIRVARLNPKRRNLN